ncbi:MAG TPA: SDR family oxidoreductase [Candidatus Binataceae bacterium]|nr:SDR family oxidoreductase [Candidatus Binataceae bacterium]
MARRKVLVAGASGLVGHAAVRHFAGLPDCEVVAVSRRTPAAVPGARFVAVDLLDQRACAELFSTLSDVTHLVYAAVNEKPGLMEGWRDREQMQTNLTMLQNLFEPLEAAAKNLQHVTLLQGTKAYGAHLGPIAIPARERAPRHPHENFYWLQEDYLRARQPGKRWAWTILRPQLVIGEAVGSNLNVIPAIGVYAAIRREAGLPLSYPGGPRLIFEMVDVDLLARAMHWAADTPLCRNEIYNITNGDVFVWSEVWPTIAEALGMKVGPPQPLSLAATMPQYAAQWAAIVRKYQLRAPEDMHAFVGESFHLADFTFNTAGRHEGVTLVSTIKARQHGFHDCMDTEDMLRKWFRRFQELKLLPPVV